MSDRERTTYVEIRCPETSGRRIIRLARGVSRLIHYQHVDMRPSSGEEAPGIYLRAFVSEEIALKYWPALRSLLDREDLLDQCRVLIGDETTDEQHTLWPPQE